MFHRLFNIQPHDEGQYICMVTNEVGTTRDNGLLRVSGKLYNTIQYNSRLLEILKLARAATAITGYNIITNQLTLPHC